MQYSQTRMASSNVTSARPATTILGSQGIAQSFGATRVGSNIQGISQTGVGSTRVGSQGISMPMAASSVRQAMPSSGRIISGGSPVSAGYAGASTYSPTNRPYVSAGTTGTLMASTREVATPTVIQASSPQVIRSSPQVSMMAGASVGYQGGVVGQARVLSGGIAGGVSSQYITAAPQVYASAPRAASAAQAEVGGRMLFVGMNAEDAKYAYESNQDPSSFMYNPSHSHDPQLSNLKQLKKACGLKKVPVRTAAEAFKAAAQGTGKLTRDQFMAAKAALLTSCGVEAPAPEVSNAVFSLFDKDDNGIVDMMEIVCGVSLLCKGSEDEKVEAVFLMFDDNGDGYVTVDEMYKFLTTVFKVVCTPDVMDMIKGGLGVQVDSSDDMASATTMECFQAADLNHDGKLSLDEFKKWFYAPRNDPSLLFQPVKQMLN